MLTKAFVLGSLLPLAEPNTDCRLQLLHTTKEGGAYLLKCSEQLHQVWRGDPWSTRSKSAASNIWRTPVVELRQAQGVASLKRKHPANSSFFNVELDVFHTTVGDTVVA